MLSFRISYMVLLLAAHGGAQSTPDELAKRVAQLWETGSGAEFAAVYPFREGRELHAGITRAKVGRTKGLSAVIDKGEKRAVLLLASAPLTGNSGDDTIYGMEYSGVYESLAENGVWRLERRLPLEDFGAILSHRLKVAVRPGQGLEVEDRLRVSSNGRGFVARLNHAAQLHSVKTGGVDVQHHWGGGLLWIGVRRGESEVTLKYTLDVDTSPKQPNSGCFKSDFGHVRNQYFWHPVFSFSSNADQADFEIEATIPKDFKLTTSIPQDERVVGEERVIQGKTVQRTFALTLAYDREWTAAVETAGKTRLVLFVTPEFRPTPAAVAKEFRAVHTLLASRFGEPNNGYSAIVELRANPGNHWHFNSNQAAFAAGSPGHFSVNGDKPSASLAHEIGHFWTRGAGPAANFLREGWATYVESLALEQEFGPTTSAAFWKHQARSYFELYEGKAAMLGSSNSSNLNYHKGGWVFRMLEEAAGREGFQKAMAEYSRRSLAGEAEWDTLADCFQKQNGVDFDVRQFLLPWLQEKTAPQLTATVNGRSVTVSQQGPQFILPVTLQATTATGVERKRVWLRGDKATIEFTDSVSSVRIDPDEWLLLRR
jgi:hypothetical protein